MLNAKMRAEMDQVMVAMKELYPASMRGLYLEYVKEGFDEHQALELIKTHILAWAGVK